MFDLPERNCHPDFSKHYTEQKRGTSPSASLPLTKKKCVGSRVWRREVPVTHLDVAPGESRSFPSLLGRLSVVYLGRACTYFLYPGAGAL